MAGDAAREAGRRQRSKGRRSEDPAEPEGGPAGAATTHAVLVALPAEEWTVFHDVRWPGRRRANIDHVVVGPAGVFVIDSQTWTGEVEVRDQVLRQDGRVRDLALAEVAEAAVAVARLVPAEPPSVVTPVLCFVREGRLTDQVREVVICTTATLAEMLTSRPPKLTPERARAAATELDVVFTTTSRSADLNPYRPAPPPDRPPVLRPAEKSATSDGLVRLAIGVGLALVLVTQASRIGDLTTALTRSVLASAVGDTADGSTYDDCADLVKDYPHGVATTRAARTWRHGNRSRPAAEPDVYQANTSLDTDDDGVACEK